MSNSKIIKVNLVLLILFLTIYPSYGSMCQKSKGSISTEWINPPEDPFFLTNTRYTLKVRVLDHDTFPIAGEKVDVMFNLPGNSPTIYTSYTDSDGIASYSIIMVEEGMWDFTALWNGNDDYEGDSFEFSVDVQEGQSSSLQTSISLETFSRDNKIWLKGDVLASGALVYNADVEISVNTPNGVLDRSFSETTAQMDDNDFSVHGFEIAILDLLSEPVTGEWTAYVTFDGDDDWPSSSNSISFTVGDPHQTQPSTDRKDCYFQTCSVSVDNIDNTLITLSRKGDISINAKLLEVGTDLPIPNALVEISLNRNQGGGEFHTIETNAEGVIDTKISGVSDGRWVVLLYFSGNAQYNPANCENIVEIDCIIATAAYGSRMHPDVKQMRSLRDDKVRTSFTGNNFVNVFLFWYYSWSPPVARVIFGSGLLRGVFRLFLTPLVFTMRISETVYDLFAFLPEFAACVSILTAAALCGVFYIAPLFFLYDRIGVLEFVSRKFSFYFGLIMVVLSVFGSLSGSVLLNTFGFGSLAVLITLSTGHTISNRITRSIHKHNR